jgi:hypothetical protein
MYSYDYMPQPQRQIEVRNVKVAVEREGYRLIEKDYPAELYERATGNQTGRFGSYSNGQFMLSVIATGNVTAQELIVVGVRATADNEAPPSGTKFSAVNLFTFLDRAESVSAQEAIEGTLSRDQIVQRASKKGETELAAK